MHSSCFPIRAGADYYGNNLVISTRDFLANNLASGKLNVLSQSLWLVIVLATARTAV